MTRTEAIDLIQAKLKALPDERVEVLAELAQAWTTPTVYSTLPVAEQTAIGLALDELDRGEGVAWDSVATDLAQKLKAAGL